MNTGIFKKQKDILIGTFREQKDTLIKTFKEQKETIIETFKKLRDIIIEAPRKMEKIIYDIQSTQIMNIHYEIQRSAFYFLLYINKTENLLKQ